MVGRIFDLFVQVDNSVARSQGGLGIGLTLVRSLVELHGGSVEAHSEGPGTGSRFTVRLPLASQALRNEIAIAPAVAPPVPTGQRPVLVVDDNHDAANSLAILLRLKGNEVRVANDGPAALRAVANRRPDLIFLDIGMPGMDGYEVARRVRQDPALAGVLLVALTGWGQEEDRRRTTEAGFDVHLVKPVEPGALDNVLTHPKLSPLGDQRSRE
jgi:CheY-like chemotaxis protein